MTRKSKHFIFLITFFVATSCTPLETTVEPADTALPSALPVNSTADVLPDSTENLLELPSPIVGTVALDFTDLVCNASWSNNGELLPCSGNLEEISSGYAGRFDTVIIEGDIHIHQPGLLTIPAQKGSGYYAIFGKYPPFTVQAGDRFQAVLTCAVNSPNCDVSFSLEYYASSNTVLQVPDAQWDKQYDPMGDYIYADTSLDSLAGQTVQFLLAVRDNGDAAGDYAAWIMPQIARHGSAATDAIPPHQLKTTNVEMVNVTGTVDMSSAPPYLYDDHPPGSPASVVLFDLNSEMFFTVSTKNTHPDFSLEVYPGQFLVMAYSYGVGDIPYVSGAYTGIDPSCGQSMAVLNVLPDTPVTNLVINDWNWSCSGTADRVEKPDEVSLP
jgi:hypothetical protein